MKISIVTPTRQNIGCLPRCIGSISQQKGVAWEHIVIDGASTDGTVDWLASYTARLTLQQNSGFGEFSWISEPDSGMYDAINKGWKKSTGDILAWLNADEQYMPGLFERVIRCFDSHPELDVLYGDTIIVDDSGNPLIARREVPLRHWYIRNTFLNVYSCTMFFRRRLLEQKLLVFDIKYRYAGDMDLILRLLAANVQHQSTHSYHSLFTVTSSNLSFHPQMKAETDEIQRKHGAITVGLGRKGVQLVRQLERLYAGCYMRQTVNYLYVINEDGESRHKQGMMLSGRFDFAKWQQIAKRTAGCF